MYIVPVEDWKYLKSKLDAEFLAGATINEKSGLVVLSLNHGYKHTDLMELYGGIIQDSLNEEGEATPDTNRFERIWNLYFSQSGTLVL